MKKIINYIKSTFNNIKLKFLLSKKSEIVHTNHDELLKKRINEINKIYHMYGNNITKDFKFKKFPKESIK